VIAGACVDAAGPAPPPVFGYDLQRNGTRTIYRAAVDGTDTTALTTGSGDDRQPTSAGGTVVFVSSRDGNGELYAVPAAGGSPRRLTFTAANEADPALSPDGTRLAYTRDDGGLPRLWLAGADGSGAVRVTDSLDYAGAVDASPSWAPGSDRVAFVSTTSGSARLYALTLATMHIAPLLPDTAVDVEPAWSPDGQAVAFTSGANGGGRLALLTLATGAVTFLTPAASRNGQPAWLPDGRLLLLSLGASPALAWVDPRAPATVHAIDVGPGVPGHPTPIRP